MAEFINDSLPVMARVGVSHAWCQLVFLGTLSWMMEVQGEDRLPVWNSGLSPQSACSGLHVASQLVQLE